MIRNISILLLVSLSFGTVTDIDENVYETVVIGAQLWMAENLKVTHYNDGSEIQYVQQESSEPYVWENLSTGAYAVYPTDDGVVSQSTCGDDCADVYGNLYNWYTVGDDRGVCPEGWHVPSDNEYTVLTDYLGDDAGGKMKSTGTIENGDGLWPYYSDEVTEGATNESGYNGFPGGYRYDDNGNFNLMGNDGNFWSSSEGRSSHAWYRVLYYNNSSVYRLATNKQNGFSIRCLADEITTGCTDPEACNYDESATADDGSCEYPDECGVCDGDGYAANCVDNAWGGACVQMDCSGTCANAGGTAVYQEYFTDLDGDGLGSAGQGMLCSDDIPSNYVNNNDDTDDDCDSNLYDQCGICTGSHADGSSDTADGYAANCVDNAWGGGCVQMDCSGTCANAGGTAVYQEYFTDLDGDGLGSAGQGMLCSDDIPSNYVNNNDDTDDDCDSNLYDQCGICTGNHADGSSETADGYAANCVDNAGGACVQMDCSGTCVNAGGTAVYQEYFTDLDSDNLGSGSQGDFCSQVDTDDDPTTNNAEANPAVADYVTNSDDTDDDCDSNLYDECDICTGSHADGSSDTADGYAANCVDNAWGGGCVQMDCSGTCANAGGTAVYQEYFTDLDGDGLGSAGQGMLCSDDIPSNYVNNNDDTDDDCDTNEYDQCAICTGNGAGGVEYNGQNFVVDCVGSQWNAVLCTLMDCSGVCGGVSVLDDCSVCDGDNSSCLGCTDINASNYDPDATIDDGSCGYEPHFETAWEDINTTIMAIYINSAELDGEALGNGDEIGIFDGDVCVGVARLEGNIEETYQVFVTADDPETPEIDGYTAGNTVQYRYWDVSSQEEIDDIEASITDGSSEFDDFGTSTVELSFTHIYGCTDPEALNYDENANTDDGSCEAPDLGCTDPYACNYDDTADMDDGSCSYNCYGCTDPYALNYDSDATIDDNSCEYPNLGDMNGDGYYNVLDIIQVVNLILDGEYITYGDVNQDSFINVLDVVILVNWILYGAPPICDGVEDIDGNCYETIQIGEQIWMAENLKVTHYNNGDDIPYPSNEEFGSYDEGQYGVYDNDPSNADIYGNLYNWAVINDDRGVCPDGWHVPSDEEYTILTDFLGGEDVAGGKMKETGLDHWNSPNGGATNESGFTGLGGGERDGESGAYNYVGDFGDFWSSSEHVSSTACVRDLNHSSSSVERYTMNKHYGFSIRCLGD